MKLALGLLLAAAISTVAAMRLTGTTAAVSDVSLPASTELSSGPVQTPATANFEAFNRQWASSFKLAGSWVSAVASTGTAWRPTGADPHSVSVTLTLQNNVTLVCTRTVPSGGEFFDSSFVYIVNFRNQASATLFPTQQPLAVDAGTVGSATGVDTYNYNWSDVQGFVESGDCWGTLIMGGGCVSKNCSLSGTTGCKFTVSLNSGRCYEHTCDCPSGSGWTLCSAGGASLLSSACPRLQVTCN